MQGGYTILRQNSGVIEAISHAQESDGMLAKGTYLTVVTSDTDEPVRKSILKVVGSEQHEVYSPSPLIADFELASTDTAVSADNKCKNFIKAVRVFDIGEREDGKIDFIKAPAEGIAIYPRRNQRSTPGSKIQGA